MTSMAASAERQHAYLGELEDVEHVAQSYFPEGAIVKLPLVVLPDIVRCVHGMCVYMV